MTIRAIIFDLGGVLLRTEDQAPRLGLAARLGVPLKRLYAEVFDSLSAEQAMIGRISVDAHWEAVRASLGLPAEEIPILRTVFWEGDRLDLDLIEYLRGLRKRYKTALLSNAWLGMREIIEQEWKIADAFDQMIISAEVGVAKPDVRIYQLAAEMLDVHPAEAVFVDDFIENVEGARAFGFHTIHFRGSQSARSELEAILPGQESRISTG